MIRTVLLALFMLLTTLTPAQATALDTKTFAQIPVLYEGRVKPLDSFARLHLKKISGHEKNANQWLAETLFDPTNAIEEKIFFIADKEVKRQMGLNPEEKYFSYADLQPGLEKTKDQITALLQVDQNEITPQQNHLLQLHDNVLSYTELLRSLSLILPLDLHLPEKYEVANATYLDLIVMEPEILDDLKALIKRKGEDVKTYTEEEAKLAELSFNLQILRLSGETNNTLLIMPDAWNTENQQWYSPWGLLLNGQGAPQSKAYLDLWRDMAYAYRNADAAAWDSANNDALNFASKNVSLTKLQLEVFYNTVKPFHWALALYALGLVFIITTLKVTKPVLKNGAILSISSGALIHLSGIAARVFLLDRPPVGTLYESVIFVSFICAIFAVISYTRSKSFAGTFAGTIAAGGLLLIAPYLIPSGQNMEMLVAVLNTNFWLTTHVLCITAGYALSILTAGLAHAYLFARWKNGKNAAKNLQAALYRTSVIALLLMAVGTALGGIWADQSWGRFWGWDPKENGALLIVLWLIWIQHGRHSGKLRPLTFAASAAFLNIIVALSWFGVNLLSVGLHSYGFIDGIAVSLATFCSIEFIIIAGLWLLIHNNEKEKTNAA